MTSDLVGIPVTLAAVAAFGVALALFFVAGPLAGLAFALLGLGLVYLVVEQPGRRERRELRADRRVTADFRRADADRERDNGFTRRVLVVANHGLERDDVLERLRRFGGRRSAEVRIVAPIAPDSALQAIADDVDGEYRAAVRRIGAVVQALEAEGIEASGRVALEADARTTLAEGLDEFPPDELMLIVGEEHGWDGAKLLAEELRSKARLPVTTLNDQRRASG